VLTTCAVYLRFCNMFLGHSSYRDTSIRCVVLNRFIIRLRIIAVERHSRILRTGVGLLALRCQCRSHRWPCMSHCCVNRFLSPVIYDDLLILRNLEMDVPVEREDKLGLPYIVPARSFSRFCLLR
jgi:hypothetical protein